MFNRLTAVCAMLLIWAALPLSGAVYRDADRGLLGTMQREAAGRVRFNRLANCLSMVMRDSGIAAADLRKLKAGRKIVIDERIFDSGFRPSTATIVSSKRILREDTGLAAPTAQRLTTERKIYEERIQKLETRLTAVQTELQVERKNAQAAAKNSAHLLETAERERDAAIVRSDKAAKQVSALRANPAREFARLVIHLPAAQKAVWWTLGILAGLFGAWVERKLYYEPRRFIRENEIQEKAPNGALKKGVYEEKYGGYTCEECQEKRSRAATTDETSLQGIGIKDRESFRRHLATSKNHVDLHLINAA